MCEAAPPAYFHPYQVVFPARTPDTDMPAIFLSAIFRRDLAVVADALSPDRRIL